MGSKSVIVHALLYTGSTTTRCKQSLIEELGVMGTDITYHLTMMKGKCEENHGVEVNLQIIAVEGEALELRDVWSTSELPISLHNLPTQQKVRQWSHLSDIQILDIPAREVTLLIGIDNSQVFENLEERRGKPEELFAVKTPLGWMMYGLPSSTESQNSLFHVTTVQKQDDTLTQKMQRMWKTDFSDSLSNPKSAMSVEDKTALRMMES